MHRPKHSRACLSLAILSSESEGNHAFKGAANTLELGTKSEIAHKWAHRKHRPDCLGGPKRCKAGGKIRSGPQMGGLATSSLPLGGSRMLESAGQNQSWPLNGQIGYIVPTGWGFPNASKQGTKSKLAHKLANWLYEPYCLGDPQRFRVGDKVRSGPRNRRKGYITPPIWGIPNALERATKAQVTIEWVEWLHHPCYLLSGVPQCLTPGAKSELARKWADWLHHPLPSDRSATL